jgi:hypothetical protein
LTEAQAGRRAFRASTDTEVDRLLGTGLFFQRQVVRVLELFLDAPARSLTARELAPHVPQYNARIYSIRRAGIPLPSLKDAASSPYFCLAVDDQQAAEIRQAIELASKVNAGDRKKIIAAKAAQSVADERPASQPALFTPPTPTWIDPEAEGFRR